MSDSCKIMLMGYSTYSTHPFLESRKIFLDNVFKFERTCELYKSILDANLGNRFCIGPHCKTVYMVEIKTDSSNKWGATPRMFHSQEEAEKEVEVLKQKYPSFVTECRIVTRRIKEEKDQSHPLLRRPDEGFHQ